MRKLIGSLAAVAALLAPSSAFAQASVIPVTIQTSAPTLMPGTQVRFTVPEPTGPCPQYNWTFTAAGQVQDSILSTPTITIPPAASLTATVSITDSCESSRRTAMREFPVVVLPLTRRAAVEYVYRMVAMKLHLNWASRTPLSGGRGQRFEQFGVKARCGQRRNQLTIECSFEGGCCEEFVRGRGIVYYTADPADDRFHFRFRVEKGSLVYNKRTRKLREHVHTRVTWQG